VGQIVVGYDGSDSSKAALEEAASLAKDLGDGLVLVFGYAPPGIWGGEIAEHEEAIEEFGEKVMAEGRERAASAGVEAEIEMVAKRGPEALISVADGRGARMIVVGSHGEPPLKGMILGSTPGKLLHMAERPVLVVPPKD
jgi:nucleotide-binding universal stress UspA family protein